jgi:hypothetical protein
MFISRTNNSSMRIIKNHLFICENQYLHKRQGKNEKMKELAATKISNYKCKYYTTMWHKGQGAYCQIYDEAGHGCIGG